MRVYIAGPISIGNQVENVRRAVMAADQVLKAGHSPFCPHLDFFWRVMTGTDDYETWLRLDFDFLSVCDALIRLPGASPGSDREVAFALGRKIPVFYGVEEFLNVYRSQ